MTVKCSTDNHGHPQTPRHPPSNSARLYQRIARQRAVVVVIACPAEACTATARGTIAVPGSAKAFKLTPVTKQISAGSKATLKLGITKRALTAIGRALKHHKRLSARLTVSAQDAAKNVTAKQRTIRLKR